MKTRDLRSLLALAAILGLVVALFAAAEFFDASLRSLCTVNAFVSCQLVDQSGKTTTFGIQDYLWGVGGFVLILLFAVVAERRRDEPVWTYGVLALTTAGVAFSAYFLYVELALIHAFCLVCAADYGFGILAWAAAIPLTVRARRRRAADAADRASDAAP
jgi:uncharacterized membrane protein